MKAEEQRLLAKEAAQARGIKKRSHKKTCGASRSSAGSLLRLLIGNCCRHRRRTLSAQRKPAAASAPRFAYEYAKAKRLNRAAGRRIMSRFLGEMGWLVRRRLLDEGAAHEIHPTVAAERTSREATRCRRSTAAPSRDLSASPDLSSAGEPSSARCAAVQDSADRKTKTPAGVALRQAFEIMASPRGFEPRYRP